MDRTLSVYRSTRLADTGADTFGASVTESLRAQVTQPEETLATAVYK